MVRHLLAIIDQIFSRTLFQYHGKQSPEKQEKPAFS